jgi:hypothetical protein
MPCLKGLHSLTSISKKKTRKLPAKKAITTMQTLRQSRRGVTIEGGNLTLSSSIVIDLAFADDINKQQTLLECNNFKKELR